MPCIVALFLYLDSHTHIHYFQHVMRPLWPSTFEQYLLYWRVSFLVTNHPFWKLLQAVKRVILISGTRRLLQTDFYPWITAPRELAASVISFFMPFLFSALLCHHSAFHYQLSSYAVASDSNQNSQFSWVWDELLIHCENFHLWIPPDSAMAFDDDHNTNHPIGNIFRPTSWWWRLFLEEKSRLPETKTLLMLDALLSASLLVADQTSHPTLFFLPWNDLVTLSASVN